MNRKESSRKPKKTISWEERNHLMLATLEETVVRIKTRRICCRIPWGFPDKCGATFRQTPGDSEANAAAFQLLPVAIGVTDGSMTCRSNSGSRLCGFFEVAGHVGRSRHFSVFSFSSSSSFSVEEIFFSFFLFFFIYYIGVFLCRLF